MGITRGRVLADAEGGIMYGAYVLEENGIPYLLSTHFQEKGAQAALDELKKKVVPSTEQVWFYVRKLDD